MASQNFFVVRTFLGIDSSGKSSECPAKAHYASNAGENSHLSGFSEDVTLQRRGAPFRVQSLTITSQKQVSAKLQPGVHMFSSRACIPRSHSDRCSTPSWFRSMRSNWSFEGRSTCTNLYTRCTLKSQDKGLAMKPPYTVPAAFENCRNVLSKLWHSLRRH